MGNIILVILLVCIVGGAGVYIYRAKKKGQPCIGCPHAKQCAGHCSSNQDGIDEKSSGVRRC